MVSKFTQKVFSIQFWYKSLFFYILICGLRKERERSSDCGDRKKNKYHWR